MAKRLLVDGNTCAFLSDLDTKQDKLTAGSGITIDENSVISSTGGSADHGTTQKSRMIDVFARKFGPPSNADPTIAQYAASTGRIYRIPSMVIDDKGNRHFFADYRSDGDQNPIETVYKRYNGQGVMECYKAITPRDNTSSADPARSRVMDTSPLYLGDGRIIVLAGRWTNGSEGWTSTSGTTMQKWYGVSITETTDYGDNWDHWVLGSAERTVYGEAPRKTITFDNVSNVSGIVGCLDRGIIWPDGNGQKWGWICQYVTTTDGSIKAGCLYTADNGSTYHFTALTDIVGCVSGEGHALFAPDGYIYFMRRCQNGNNCDCWKINPDLSHAELFDKLNNKIPNGTAKCGFEYFTAKNCRKIVLSSAPTAGGSNRKYLTTYVHMIEGANPTNAAVPMFRVNYTTAEGGICVDSATSGKNVMGYSQIIHHATADSEWLGFLYESNEGDGHMVKYMDMGDMIQDISNAMDTGITLKQLQAQGGGTPLDPEWLTNTVMDFVPSSGEEHWETPETLVVTGTGGEYANGVLSKASGVTLNTVNAMLDFPAGTNKIKFTYTCDTLHQGFFIRLARDPNTLKDVCIPVCVGTDTPYWLINSLNCHAGGGEGGVSGRNRCNTSDLQNVITTTMFGDSRSFAGTIGYDAADGEEVTFTVEYSETQVKISSSHSEDVCIVTLDSINNMSQPPEYPDEKMSHYKDAVITPGVGFFPTSVDFDITDIQMSNTAGRSLRTRVETLEHGGSTGITAHGDDNIDAAIANSVLAVGVKSGSALETLTRKVRTLTTESVLGGSTNNNSNQVTKIRIGRYYMARLKGHGDITSIKIHFRDGYNVSGAYMQASYDENFSGDTYMSTNSQNIAGLTDITFQFAGIPVKQLPLHIRFFTNASGTGDPLNANYNLKSSRDAVDSETAMWNSNSWKAWVPYATLTSTIVTDVIVPTPLQPETLIRSNGKYSVTINGDVDYSALTMEPYARAEMWMEYRGGTPTWPSDFVWEGTGTEPTWVDNTKYFISLVYDGVRVAARVSDKYAIPTE